MKKNGFQTTHLVKHVVLQLVSQILDSFNTEIFILGIFIDLSNAFGTVDHTISLKQKNSLSAYPAKNFDGFKATFQTKNNL